MGEIKSTLDIVMEKTKHLTLSDEEKQAQSQSAVKNRVKGMVQKFQDLVLREEQLKKAIASLQDTTDADIGQIVLDEIYQQLDPARDNGPLLGLLNTLFGTDTAELASLFETYRDEIRHLTEAGMADRKKALAEAQFISGSAVVPHLEADSNWQKEAQGIHQKYKAIMAGKKSDLMKAR